RARRRVRRAPALDRGFPRGRRVPRGDRCAPRRPPPLSSARAPPLGVSARRRRGRVHSAALIAAAANRLERARGALMRWLAIAARAVACAPKPKAPPEPPPFFNRIDAMVPMRDGVHLQTVIFVPREAKHPLPFLLERTPYGGPGRNAEKQQPKGARGRLAKDGYIFVWQNI